MGELHCRLLDLRLVLANVAEGFIAGQLGARPSESYQAPELRFTCLNKVSGFPRPLFLSARRLLLALVLTLALVVHCFSRLNHDGSVRKCLQRWPKIAALIGVLVGRHLGFTLPACAFLI